MEKIISIFKSIRPIDIIIVSGLVIALIVGFFTYTNMRQTADKQIEATSKIMFDVFVRGVALTGEGLPIKKDEKVIIGIGLYIERKGIVDFVELAKRLPEYKFIWFGYSPVAAATKPVRDAVNTKLDNLTFAGYVERDVIRGAMNGCVESLSSCPFQSGIPEDRKGGRYFFIMDYYS